MPNAFYNFAPEFTPGARVRAGDVNIQYAAIEDAFDMIDASNPLIPLGTAAFTTETGTTNGYVVAMPTTRTTEADGDEVIFIATHTNTAAATLEVDGLGAKDIVRLDGQPVEAGDIVNGLIYAFRYDSANTRYQLMSSSLSEYNNLYTSGTPLVNQVAIWVDDETIKGTIRLKSTTTQFTAGNYVFNTDQVLGANQNNYVLAYSHSTGEIGLKAPVGAGGALTVVTAADIDSESSTAGRVLTSDGANGAAWEALSGSGIPSNPPSTHYTVTNLYVNATTGRLVVEYDDTPEP